MLTPTRIVRAEIRAVSLTYKEPIEWTTGGIEAHADYLVVRIWDCDGRQGAAEAVCRPTWNSMSQGALLALFADIGWPLLSSTGLAPEDLGQIRNVGALTALLDSLLADLYADDQNVAPAAIAGPAVAVVTRGNPREMARAAEAAATRGFGAVKIKLGQGLATDAAVLGAVRSAVGGDFAICGDANGAYGIAECAALMRLAERHGLTFVEDPCRLTPLAASLDRMARSTVPVVVDRFCDSLLAARQFVDLGQIDIAAKPGRCGSRGAGEMLQAAVARGGHAVIGLFGETEIGALAQLRMAAGAEGTTIWGIEASFHDALTEHLLHFDLGLDGGSYAVPPTLHGASAIDWERVEALSSSALVLRK
ncbi:enolase C-terminal domain-like protein [Pelagibacterium sediminicola]|uniref:enolase C-terminal domain-like protein n=1 Tax=Pelagibacterium sediminicola TaxID=2248761 RepID=UPI000E32138A|nr:enolase C-terminal domain-like protein [Pelagibacterium sediminicola]